MREKPPITATVCAACGKVNRFAERMTHDPACLLYSPAPPLSPDRRASILRSALAVCDDHFLIRAAALECAGLCALLRNDGAEVVVRGSAMDTIGRREFVAEIDKRFPDGVSADRIWMYAPESSAKINSLDRLRSAK